MKKILKDRFIQFAIFLIILGIVITLQLVNLQIIHGKEYDEDSQRKLPRERKVTAPRGNITDRYGVPIAVNRQGFTVYIVKTDVASSEFNEALLRLIKIFEKNQETYNKTLNTYLAYPLAFAADKSEKEIIKWQVEKFALKKDEVFLNPEELFQYLRTRFKIDEKYTAEEAYKIMTIQYEIMLDKWNFDNGNSICLAKDVKPETVAEIEERHHLLPGVITDIEPVREYIDAYYVSHVIGYVRGITAEQYEKLQHEGYERNDMVGQIGIESAAERYLRGIDGQKKVEVNTRGRLTDELYGKPAIPGHNVILTIDMNLQKVAMESLESNIKLIRERGGRNNFGDANAGAAVVIDVNNGEILAMASYPAYDPSIFLAGADDKEAQKAIAELASGTSDSISQFNRVIQGAYAPGSTFKPLTAIAALEEGIITPDTIINDTGHENIGNWDFYCLEYTMGIGAHGRINLERALSTSCNLFFHIIGYRTGIDKIDKWGKLFGLGELTGVDIPYEYKGIRANKENKKKLWNDDWRPADTAQTAIGQFDNYFTPLQLANYISTIANGGKRYRPHLIKKILKYDGSIVNDIQPEYEQVPVKPETLEAVKRGMVAVTNSIDGTAVDIFKDFPFKVAGKTGTAETGKEANHSSNALFVCYAPADKPEIAVAVAVERGVWGAYAAPIARDILTEYFGLNKGGKKDNKARLNVPTFTR